MAYREADVPEQGGKTILVTGANTGLGYEAARVLAERGARVLLGCRSADRAQDALDRIRQRRADANLKWIKLDLASLSSIESAANEVQAEPRLDVLINNAGVMIPPKTTTEDGFELQFGVNHLGHFALTGRLLPMLKDRWGARIVTVASHAHRTGRILYQDLHAERSYRRMERYQMSKLANILFTHELQRRLEAAGCSAIAVACHPGGSVTELGRHIGFYRYFAQPLAWVLNSSAEGALPTLMAATHSEVQGGDYFGPAGFLELAHSARKVQAGRNSRGAADAARLWEASSELTGVSYAF